MLLTHRKLLQSKAIAIENDLRGTLRNFGHELGERTSSVTTDFCNKICQNLTHALQQTTIQELR